MSSNEERRWYLKPLRAPRGDWKHPVDDTTRVVDSQAQLALRLLLDPHPIPPVDVQVATDAAYFDALARALEPRITELQARRMEGQK